MKIGVFDSGVGGLSVVNAIQKEIPKLEIVYRDDKKHIPYGNREVSEIYGFVKPILNNMVNDGCKVIVIACNTVTTNLISRLRDEIKVPLVGMEPMVKPASHATKTNVITVCATPLTLKSDRYGYLKRKYAAGIRVLEPDCSGWSYMIETNKVDTNQISKVVEEALSQNTDQIVLGCTHYHWIEALMRSQAKGKAEVLQPEQAVISQLKRVLEQLA